MESLVFQLNRFRERGELCNVILQVEEESFPCHRLVLQAASKYFYDIFKDRPSHTTDNVKLQQLSSNGFKEILNYMYGVDIKITDEIVNDVAITSDYLKLNLLFDRCVDLLRDGSCPSAVVQLYNFANVKNDSKLLDVMKELILNQFSKVSETDDFLSLTLEEMKLLLDGVPKKMILSEDPIYKWVEHDEEKRKGYLNELLEIVHLIGLQVNKTNSKETLNSTCEENIKLTNVVKRYCSQSSKCAKAKIFWVNNPINDLTIFAKSSDSEADEEHEEEEEENVVTVNYLRNGNIIESEKNLKIVCDTLGAVKQGKMYFVLSIVEDKFKFEKLDIGTGSTCDLTPPPAYSLEYILTTNGTEVFLYLSGEKLSQCDNYSDFDDNRFSKYDTNVDLWFSLPKNSSQNITYYNCCVVSSLNGLYQMGGLRPSHGGAGAQISRKAVFLDIRTSDWVSLPPMQSHRYNASGCFYDNKLYVSGGHDSRTVEIFDILSHNEWIKSNPMPTERQFHKMMCVDGNFYVFGGKDKDYNKYDNFITASVKDINKILMHFGKYLSNLPDTVWKVTQHDGKEIVDVVY